jgi:hypothetical protein
MTCDQKMRPQGADDMPAGAGRDGDVKLVSARAKLRGGILLSEVFAAEVRRTLTILDFCCATRMLTRSRELQGERLRTLKSTASAANPC